MNLESWARVRRGGPETDCRSEHESRSRSDCADEAAALIRAVGSCPENRRESLPAASRRRPRHRGNCEDHRQQLRYHQERCAMRARSCVRHSRSLLERGSRRNLSARIGPRSSRPSEASAAGCSSMPLPWRRARGRRRIEPVASCDFRDVGGAALAGLCHARGFPSAPTRRIGGHRGTGEGPARGRATTVATHHARQPAPLAGAPPFAALRPSPTLRP